MHVYDNEINIFPKSLIDEDEILLPAMLSSDHQYFIPIASNAKLFQKQNSSIPYNFLRFL